MAQTAPVISLREVTAENFEAVVQLKTCEDQKGFVASNAYSLAEAYVYHDLIPMAIYANATPVGFLMYGFWPERNQQWISRLMIDAEQQGKGYGRAAMGLLLERMQAIPGCSEIYISYEPENHVAKALYASFGFVVTGEFVGDEEVARLTIP